VLKLVLGEFGSVLLMGQKVLPMKLRELGFDFLHPEQERMSRKLCTTRCQWQEVSCID
jgi:NAD dependent epimerase/dehydratase family enzyme